MNAMSPVLLVYVIFVGYLSLAVSGQLSLLRSPSCSSSESVYICSDSSRTEWEIVGTGVRSRLGRDTTPAGYIANFTIGTSHISFLVSSNTGSFISVTATIKNATSLNGTIIKCNGEELAITVILPELPTMLEISIEEYNVAIYPLPPSNGAYYQSSNEMMAIVNGTLFLEEAGPFNLTFSCMEMIADFIIESCIFANVSEQRNYTLLTDGTWIILQQCENGITEFIVTCSMRNWNESLTCGNSTPLPPNTSMGSTGSMPTIQSESTMNGDNNTSSPANDSFLIIAIVLAVVVFVVSLVVVILVIVICNRRRSKKSMTDLNNIELPEVTYSQLSSNRSRNTGNSPRRPPHTAATNTVAGGQEEYATLKHNLPEIIAKEEEYDTINPAFATQHHQKRSKPLNGTLDSKTGPTPSSNKSYEYASSRPIVPRDDQEELLDYCTVENRDGAKPPTPDVPPNYSTPAPKSSRSKKGKSDKNKTEAAGKSAEAAAAPSEDVPHTYSKTRSVPLSAQEKTTTYTDMSGVDSSYSDIHGSNSEHDRKLDLNTLLLQLKCVREDYQKFGEAAGIDVDTMKNIVDHVSTSEEGMVEVCDLWMQKCSQKNVTPSWSGVAEILTRIGRKDWAKQIVKVYTTGELPVEVDMNAVEIMENTEPAPPPLPQRSNEEEGELEEDKVAMLTVGRGKNISYEMAKTRVSKKKPAPMPSDEPPPIPAHHGDSYKSKPVPQPPQIAPQTNDVAAPVVPPRLTAQAPNNKLPLPAKSAPEAVSKPPRQVPKPPKAAKPQVEEPQAETPPSRPPKLSALGPKPTPKN